jgi:hypothetical protein
MHACASRGVSNWTTRACLLQPVACNAKLRNWRRAVPSRCEDVAVPFRKRLPKEPWAAPLARASLLDVRPWLRRFPEALPIYVASMVDHATRGDPFQHT